MRASKLHCRTRSDKLFGRFGLLMPSVTRRPTREGLRCGLRMDGCAGSSSASCRPKGSQGCQRAHGWSVQVADRPDRRQGHQESRHRRLHRASSTDVLQHRHGSPGQPLQSWVSVWFISCAVFLKVTVLCCRAVWPTARLSWISKYRALGKGLSKGHHCRAFDEAAILKRSCDCRYAQLIPVAGYMLKRLKQLNLNETTYHGLPLGESLIDDGSRGRLCVQEPNTLYNVSLLDCPWLAHFH